MKGPVGNAISGIAGIAVGSLFMLAQPDTAAVEGGFVDHPDDLGGRTNWGVTEETARAAGYEGAIEALPESTAVRIAYERYWAPLHLDQIAATADTAYLSVAERLYDVAFNAGPGRAAQILQRCLNALNNQGRHYGDVSVDFAVGPMTLDAFGGYVGRRGKEGAEALHTCVYVMQGFHYINISERREQNESFTYGWMRRLESIAN